MQTEGTVRRINERRGFGFLEIPGESRDVFFHNTDLPFDVPFDQSLIGMRLSFRVEEGGEGSKCSGD